MNTITSGTTTAIPPKNKELPTGWICPSCGAINSPYVNQCDCTRNSPKLPEPIRPWDPTPYIPYIPTPTVPTPSPYKWTYIPGEVTVIYGNS